MPTPSDGDYEYRGLIASSWDLLRGDTSRWPDRQFYHSVIADGGQPALDVGCGTGRLLLDYMAAGLDVDGVDNSPEMLAICREKARTLSLRPKLFQQSMEALDLPRQYRTIFVPSSSYQLLTDPHEARDAMERFFDHLAADGTLVMPFMILSPEDAPRDERAKEWRLVGERSRPDDGAIVRRWARATYDMERQLAHTKDRYEVLVDGAVVKSEHHSRSPAARWYTQEQSLALYREAGFTVASVYSVFTTQPAKPDDRIWTVVGKRV